MTKHSLNFPTREFEHMTSPSSATVYCAHNLTQWISCKTYVMMGGLHDSSQEANTKSRMQFLLSLNRDTREADTLTSDLLPNHHPQHLSFLPSYLCLCCCTEVEGKQTSTVSYVIASLLIRNFIMLYPETHRQ